MLIYQNFMIIFGEYTEPHMWFAAGIPRPKWKAEQRGCARQSSRPGLPSGTWSGIELADSRESRDRG